MHYDNIIVTLTDDNKNPLREFNSRKNFRRGRTCDVFISEGTEYKFMIKNNHDRRIKIDITIDGTNVTGNGLIQSANSVDYIERFVDLNRKFKAVLASNEAVADPSNQLNGKIVVKVTVEDVPIMNTMINDWNRLERSWEPSRSMQWYSATNYSQTVSCSTKSLSYDEKIATVEGSVSNQKFGTTTWNKDGDISIFSFNLKKSNIQDDADYKMYMELKKKFG